jgi:hypothetical protein
VSTPSLFDGLDHDGEAFDRALDGKRLNAQTQKVFDLMKDGQWRTLAAISEATGAPEASVSARLRDLKKRKFGGFRVERRRVGEGRSGLWEYRVLISEASGDAQANSSDGSADVPRVRQGLPD